jgi:hypothetical protein
MSGKPRLTRVAVSFPNALWLLCALLKWRFSLSWLFMIPWLSTIHQSVWGWWPNIFNTFPFVSLRESWLAQIRLFRAMISSRLINVLWIPWARVSTRLAQLVIWLITRLVIWLGEWTTRWICCRMGLVRIGLWGESIGWLFVPLSLEI